MKYSRCSPYIALIATLAALPGCDASKAELEAARAVEATGDLFGAIAAYDAIADAGPDSTSGRAAAEAAEAARLAVADELVADGAPLFELPEECKVVQVTGVSRTDVGTVVELELDCEGRRTATTGRVIDPDKVWDLTPITGTLTTKGDCVFRSHDNPFGDWAVAVEADECEKQRRIRVDALVRAVGDQAAEAFTCDCRVGEATFEIPRGEPLWQTGPPPIPTESLPEGTQKQLQELKDGATQ